ncbi:MAG: hypothetical protein JWQ89_3338 [Devosia sp.]|nr:hypothetical protein [Devosia sp.]
MANRRKRTCPKCPTCGQPRHWEVIPGGGINARCVSCGYVGCWDNLDIDQLAGVVEYAALLGLAAAEVTDEGG